MKDGATGTGTPNPLSVAGRGGGGVPIPEVTPPFRRCRPCTVEVPAYPIFLLLEYA